MGIAASISIPYAKITAYLLNVSHAQGGSKARFFIGHGFSPDKPKELADAIRAHLVDEATDREAQPHPCGYGTKIEARGPLMTPSGRVVTIRSVWNQATGSGQAVLVTAYPD